MPYNLIRKQRVYWIMRKLFYLIMLISISCADESDEQCIDPDHWGIIEGCYEIYSPVCGCNNVTYGNDCEAKIAGAVSWTEGSCSN
jgi:hypothetical protein